MTNAEARVILKNDADFIYGAGNDSYDRQAYVIADKALENMDRPKGEWDICGKELLKIYEDRFLELQKLKQLKDNKGAEDRQMGVNYCINILKEMLSVTPQTEKGGE